MEEPYSSAVMCYRKLRHTHGHRPGWKNEVGGGGGNTRDRICLSKNTKRFLKGLFELSHGTEFNILELNSIFPLAIGNEP